MATLANTTSTVLTSGTALIDLIQHVREPLYLVQDQSTGHIGVIAANNSNALDSLDQQQYRLIGSLPAIYPEWLGSSHFLAAHNVRFAYVVGEMANGIATADMVIAAAKAQMLGFFGAGGLVPDIVAKNLVKIQQSLPETASWGANLIHSPNEPNLEEAVVNVLLAHNVRRISASAYMSLSPHVVHYACKGLRQDPNGNIVRQNHIFAKISRPEVARHFMVPAPAEILQQLVAQNKLTAQEAHLALHIPVANDITVEADSGGHTDNRPLTALFPTIFQLATQINQQYNYSTPIRVGAAGGLGSPSALTAAFSMGAAYVLTGTVNQASTESGLSEAGKQLLCQAGIADVTMAPAADMFELGVKLQVLKRGTMFASRASKLYDLYTRYDSLEQIPEVDRSKIESQIFKKSLNEIWQLTHDYFIQRDPAQIQRAQQNSKYRMALVFRWYLGLASHWAIRGEADRITDYQIWCGPAMGAFNQWVTNSPLEPLANRSVVQIAKNLMEGAAVATRAQQLRSFGMNLPDAAYHFTPHLFG